MTDIKLSLAKVKSINSSGNLQNPGRIPFLKEPHYYPEDYPLGGDAPKQFIRAYFYGPKSKVRKRNKSSWIPFVAKTAEKWYPHESVIEYMINRIGIELGLNMNEVRLVRANGQIRFLSRYFLNTGESLVHGAEICGEYLEDHTMAEEIANDKKTARAMFTFEFIENAIRVIFPTDAPNLIQGLVQMVTFDAIVGNNDRHFYNWGVIRSTTKTKKPTRFAPVYDSARGLLWNFSDHTVLEMLRNYNKGGKKFVNYLENACPRISIETDSDINHFNFIRFLKAYNEEYRWIIEQLTTREKQSRVIKMVHSEFFPMFDPVRSKLTTLILDRRFEKIRRI